MVLFTNLIYVTMMSMTTNLFEMLTAIDEWINEWMNDDRIGQNDKQINKTINPTTKHDFRHARIAFSFRKFHRIQSDLSRKLTYDLRSQLVMIMNPSSCDLNLKNERKKIK